jgi:HEAT repeat protein
MIAAAPVVGTLTATECYAAAAPDAATVPQLVDIISSDNSRSQEREDAAVLLIARNSTDARAAVKGILNNNSNIPGQIAVARAVAKAADPNPDFIPALGNLLGSNHNLTEAAAAALANCDGKPGVFDALRNYADAPSTANIDRAIAVRAMGSVVQEQVANYLIILLSAPAQNATIATAATDALAELTGITTYGDDPQQWQQWWNGMKVKNADQFRSAVLTTRDQQAKQQQQQKTPLLAAIIRDYNSSFTDELRGNRTAAERKLLGYLKDRVPEIRFVGVDIVEQNQYDSALIASVRSTLVQMIDDPDDSVRFKVVNLLLNLNASAALTPMINRLAVENNLQIKAKLAQTLGKLADIQAAPALIKLLDDPHPEIVTAGAKALAGELGKKLRDTDETKANAASDALRKIFNANDDQPGTEELRAACLAALGALRDKKSLSIFMDHVVPAQPAEVRRKALAGLGSLGDEKADATVAGVLDDRDPTIRLQAAEAMKTVATTVYTDAIFQRMKDDHDPSVQAALWIALSQNLYPKLKPKDLSSIADDLNNDPSHTKDPDRTRRLYTLQKLMEKHAAARDDEQVAFVEQDIASALMAVNPPHIQEAIDTLKKAMEYWRAKGNGDKLQAIIEPLLDDELQAKQWDNAVKFASDQIKFDPAYQPIVIPKIKNKLDELINSDHPDLESAKALIDALLKLDQNQIGKYVTEIQQLQANLKAKTAAPPG